MLIQDVRERPVQFNQTNAIDSRYADRCMGIGYEREDVCSHSGKEWRVVPIGEEWRVVENDDHLYI